MVRPISTGMWIYLLTMASIRGIKSMLFRPPVLSDEELKEMIKDDHYLNAKPVTFYTEKLDHGTFYGS